MSSTVPGPTTATHKVGVQSCKVYVKPEEGTAYYVINKVSGKLDL